MRAYRAHAITHVAIFDCLWLVSSCALAFLCWFHFGFKARCQLSCNCDDDSDGDVNCGLSAQFVENLLICTVAAAWQRCHSRIALPPLSRSHSLCVCCHAINHTHIHTHMRRTLHAHLHVVYPPKKNQERYMKLFTPLSLSLYPLSFSLLLCCCGIYNAFLMVLKMFPLRFALQQRLN